MAHVKIARGNEFLYAGVVQPPTGVTAAAVATELTTASVTAANLRIVDGTLVTALTAAIDATTSTITLTLTDAQTTALTKRLSPDLKIELEYTTLGGAGDTWPVEVPDVFSIVDYLWE